ncbi:hypothetical protein CEXT_484021 [Caerostris extrusa]|uniref:Uncharacterized protein n=1 Tax=Caerostris extrusa TaxID=172846 RepID=A0AAV4PHU5_CAEEX|nr:hypothetical protein CEXT_484021 [Caerostris extrusa]
MVCLLPSDEHCKAFCTGCNPVILPSGQHAPPSSPREYPLSRARRCLGFDSLSMFHGVQSLPFHYYCASQRRGLRANVI